MGLVFYHNECSSQFLIFLCGIFHLESGSICILDGMSYLAVSDVKRLRVVNVLFMVL